uniref:Uncharacterized protein n=1 Tax=Haemonchus placei TaxID=6290 RepID=A0A0N4VXR6_HAEPC
MEMVPSWKLDSMLSTRALTTEAEPIIHRKAVRCEFHPESVLEFNLNRKRTGKALGLSTVAVTLRVDLSSSISSKANKKETATLNNCVILMWANCGSFEHEFTDAIVNPLPVFTRNVKNFQRQQSFLWMGRDKFPNQIAQSKLIIHRYW